MAWFKMMLVPQLTVSDGELHTTRKIIIGTVDKPARMPWWFNEAFEAWAKGSNRELTWKDFPEEEWLEELYCRNRPIHIGKPTYPVERPKFALVNEKIMEKLQRTVQELEGADLDPRQSIDPNFLRGLGVVFQQDLQSDTQFENLKAQGYGPVNVTDLMPWLKDDPSQKYMDFIPAVAPKEGTLHLGAGQIMSWAPWEATEEWMAVIADIWGAPLQVSKGSILRTLS